MREYFTEAVVLGVRPHGECGRMVDLYTKDLGRVEAVVVSGRKITSKLAPHFTLGSKALVRLVWKNQFTVTDVLGEGAFLGKASVALRIRILDLFFLLRSLLPFAVPDLNIWHRLSESLEKRSINLQVFLKILGYDATLARCDECGSGRVKDFFVTNQVFACEECVRKLPDGETVLISQ